jgi:hypothetical protein
MGGFYNFARIKYKLYFDINPKITDGKKLFTLFFLRQKP